ncbi:MAG: KpsF/GutQ family sugar-phosphate isomerase [Myxococcota bacterium]
MSRDKVTKHAISLGEMQVDTVLEEARRLLEVEGAALNALAHRVDASFIAAVRLMFECKGLVVVTGMGKSGLVAQKISATLASTGTPSLFLHAAEAVHGDLGRLSPRDVVLALSNSGESEETVRLVRPVRALGAPLIAMTGDHTSSLARHADVTLDMGELTEAGSLGLVPTVSTTAMMALGDALAVCLFECRGFGPEEYARFHPGGALGRKLMKVYEVMRRAEHNPLVDESTTLAKVLHVMTSTPGRPGAATVVDGDGRVAGFFTDGDLRRLLEKKNFDVETSVATVMHRNPKSVSPEQLVVEAAALMREHKIDQLPVIDSDGRPVGFLDVQDLLSARIT